MSERTNHFSAVLLYLMLPEVRQTATTRDRKVFKPILKTNCTKSLNFPLSEIIGSCVSAIPELQWRDIFIIITHGGKRIIEGELIPNHPCL